MTVSSSRRQIINVPCEPMIRLSADDDELLAVVYFDDAHSTIRDCACPQSGFTDLPILYSTG